MKAEFDEYLATLGRTERLPLRELAGYQQRLLACLVCHAYEHVPFYRDRLGCLFTKNHKIDLSRWNEVPLLSRDDVIRHGPDIRVRDLPAEHGEVAEPTTSGSTGIPLRIATNGSMFFAANALVVRMARWFGMDTSRPLAIVGRFSDQSTPPEPNRSKSGWTFADSAAPRYELELLTPVDQQLAWLARWRAPYLQTHPSSALALAHAVSPDQGRALGIETVLMNGETVPDGAREFIAERLGARAAAFYSCQEVGHIASECDAAQHYHVSVENVLVEIVDDRGHDVRPGERGRVVVTGLYNYAMPFIRYELGDVAVAGAGPCRCGRTLPVISRIEGRTRNAFVFRDGSRRWPRTSMVRAMRPFVPFARFQLVQKDYEKIEFRYVPDGSGRKPDITALNAHARRVLHPSVEVDVVELDALVPGPGGKFEEFISRIAESRVPMRASE